MQSGPSPTTPRVAVDVDSLGFRAFRPSCVSLFIVETVCFMEPSRLRPNAIDMLEVGPNFDHFLA